MTAMDAEWGVAMRLDSVMPFPWPMTLELLKLNSFEKLVKEWECKKKDLNSLVWSYFRY